VFLEGLRPSKPPWKHSQNNQKGRRLPQTAA